MQYRALGGTGFEASVIGLGCEHLDGKPYERCEETVRAALDAGVNILDVFMPGKEIRENIRRALGGRRKDVLIQGHIGSTDLNQQYDISRDMPSVEKYFEDLLRIYDGYIDIGMLFFIDSEKNFKDVFDTPFITYAQNLQRDGKIRALGFSSHSPNIAKRVIETGAVQTMMFSVNPAFDMLPVGKYVFDALDNGLETAQYNGIDPDRAALYALCEARNIGVTTMKTYGAGKLLSVEHSPYRQPLTPAQCIHYALTRPAVCSVLPGCQTAREVAQALSYLTATDEERDYTGITPGHTFHGQCVYCGHCQPCPAGIDIAAVHRYLDIARLNPEQVPDSLRAHYRALPAGGADCTACGSCESRCPFGVNVIRDMAEAARTLGGTL
jgi:predicted aldo/keto reductase-like oxidoreductase